MCFRREDRQGSVILVGAGSGMSPIWSILNDQLTSGEDRSILFFYGARTQDDLFKLEELTNLIKQYPLVEFIPVLSHEDDDSTWDGERGFVHECVERRIKAMDLNGEGDVYACGPPPMIDALTPVLFMNDFETDRIFIDKFTPTSGSSSVH